MNQVVGKGEIYMGRLFFIGSVLNIFFVLVRNLRTIIGLAFLIITGYYGYHLYQNDMDFAVAFTKTFSFVINIWEWMKAQASKFSHWFTFP